MKRTKDEKEQKGIVKKLLKYEKKKAIVKDLVRRQKVTVTIKQGEPAPYVNRYFQKEWEESGKNFFFK